LLEEVEPGTQAHEDLIQVRELARRAAALTQQLLAFSRRQTLDRSVVDLNELVEQTLAMLRRIIGEDITVEFKPAPDLGRIYADPTMVEQVLMNLAVNARDAMPRGGMLIIETQNAFLDEEYAARHVDVRPGPYVMLAVTDTGCGMDDYTRQRAFEPFFSTKEPGKGTGLGLSTVYGIVKQHGGNIWIYSEVGKGTTVKIYLPRTACKDSPEAEESSGEIPAAGRGETVLVVEDEEAVRALVCRVLKGRGYRLLCASSAEEARRLFDEHAQQVALLLTDVVLPDGTGSELYEQLRAGRADLRCLYMSGYPDASVVRNGMLDAGRPFLQKPFKPGMLVKKVREVLADDRGNDAEGGSNP